jgi:UDP-N-acetylglucosamine 2-epimerase (non-hydrolysing)
MGRIVTIIGTRPEIIKMAPVVKALDTLSHDHILVHSGQHYDLMMDRIFFKDMKLRQPDFQFELKAKPPHLQVANTIRGAAVVMKNVDLVIVHGDTNTTLAGALLGHKLGLPVAHVEAGIRSFDKTMPEEVNRLLTDQVSQLLFPPTSIAKKNLENENIRTGLHVVGNSVIDALKQNLRIARRSKILRKLGLKRRRYAVLTFHRAENVDRAARLRRVLVAMREFASREGIDVVFPIHPRTEKMARRSGLLSVIHPDSGFRVIPPTGYLDMLELERNAALVFTDSGGLQEESCFFRVPCVTLRENTERPETLKIGANVLAGTDPKRILRAAENQLAAKRNWPNPYGDGTTGRRIARIVDGFVG